MSLKLEGLKEILSPDQISDKKEELKKYANDWLKHWEGEASLLLFPKSTSDLVSIVRWARQNKYSLVPSGGRTGLSGGAVAIQKEVAVSFEKMNKILEFNPWEKTVHVEAGCITQDLQDFARSKGLYFPISFGAEGSSQIGGNIATNVGGVHVLRYGNMRQRVLGLEVVDGRGEILNLGRGLVKNAVGYNLKDLFIGSEGTLAFVTRAILSLVSPPDNPQVFLISLDSSEKLLDLFKEFRDAFSPLAFEFWTDKALDYVLSHGNKVFPLSQRGAFYILMEIEERDKEKALAIFEKAFGKGLLKDGVLSQSSAQAKEIWKFREDITEAISSYTPYKNDISVRISRMTDFLKDLEKFLNKNYPDFDNIIFGHLGDGNLHINILKPKEWEKKDFISKCEKLSHVLFDLIQKYEGSVSAEHGVGLLKKPYLNYSCSKEEIEIMKSIKKILDPDHILNPGKIFDL